MLSFDDLVPLLLKTATEKEQSVSQEVGSPVRKVYCVDENIERRNHYLDLAGIENYTSKFDNKGKKKNFSFIVIAQVNISLH